jgi:hypothetical protein
MALQMYEGLALQISESFDLPGWGSGRFEEPTFNVVEPRLGVNPNATVPIYEVGF